MLCYLFMLFITEMYYKFSVRNIYFLQIKKNGEHKYYYHS